MLLVDDSEVFRRALEKSLSGQPDMQVAGSVSSAEDALEFIRKSFPDIVLMNPVLPEMDGVNLVRKIQKFVMSSREGGPGIILISDKTRKDAAVVIEALESGALDFITRPREEMINEDRINYLRDQLLTKIRLFVTRRNFAHIVKARKEKASFEFARPTLPRAKAVFIGVSTGGPRVLADLLPKLCRKVKIPIFIVQHMSERFTAPLAKSLSERCEYPVVEVTERLPVQDQHVYLAAGNKHMVVKAEGQGYVVEPFDGPQVNNCKPSVNVLFESAATAYGSHAVALVLTGMGNDGTDGARSIRSRGGLVIAQDESSSVIWGMPGNAVAAGCVDDVLALDEMLEAVAAVAV